MKRLPNDSQPDISYPTRWTYSVIGLDREQLEGAIAEVVDNRSHTISLSKVSSKGRYVSLTLELIVLNEAERHLIFESLSRQPAVTVVL